MQYTFEVSRENSMHGPGERRIGVFTVRRAALLIDLLVSGPSTGPEIAGRLGIHVNTIREHLDRLLAERFVTASPQRTGRPGRSAVVYALCDGAAPNVLDAHRLASAVAVGRALHVGFRQDEQIALARRSAVFEHLEGHGFDPAERSSAPGELVVECPLTDAWPELGERLCAAHARVLEQVATQVDGPPVRVVLEPHEPRGTCRVFLVTEPETAR